MRRPAYFLHALVLCILASLLPLTAHATSTASAAAPAKTAAAAAAEPTSGAGQYFPLTTPTRFVDTGTALGVPTTTLVPAQGLVTSKFTGRGGVPATGVSGLAVNIHVTNPTANGTIPAWSAGTTRPGVATLNFYAGTGTTSTPALLKPNANGEVSFQNLSSGTLRLMVDVAGYYSDDSGTAIGSRFVPLPQSRIVDTRNAIGVTTRTPIGPNKEFTTAVAGRGGLPAVADITAVAVNVTVLAPGALGRWTLFPPGTSISSANNAFYFPSRAKTASAIARLSADGRLSLYNASTGSAHYMVEVVGYYTPANRTNAAHLRVQATTPTRILDTGATLVPAGQTTTLKVAGKAGLPAEGVTMAALHVIGIGSATGGQLVAYPPGSTPPFAADVMFPPSQYSYNLLWARLDSTGSVTISNGTNAGIHLYVDLQAYATRPAAPGRPTNVVASPLSGSAQVSWSEPTETGDLPIRDYEVTASPGGASVVVGGTSGTVSGLTNGQQYTFSVKARTAAASSVPSAASDPVVPVQPQAPGKPFVTDVTPRDSELQVSWAAPPTGPKSVETYRVVVNPGGVTKTVPGTVTDTQIGGLTNGTSYRVTVFAGNAIGEQASDPSNEAAPEPADVPLTPILGSATALNGRIDLQWLPASDGGSTVTQYEVTASPGGQVLTTAGDTTVLSIPGLTNDVEYTFSLRARNKIGLSAERVVKATPVAARVPVAPIGVQASTVAAGQVLLKWDAPSDPGTSPVTGYVVEVGPGGREIRSATTSVTVTGLEPTAEVSFTVRAENAAGASARSEPTEPLTPAISLATTPVVLSATSMAQLRYAHGDGTLVFEAPGQEVRVLKAGDIVVVPASAKTPRGLLRRVTAIVDQGGLFTVSTAEASLTDVFDDGALAARAVIDDTDVAGFVPADPRVKLREATIGGRTLRTGAAKAGSKQTKGAPSIGLRDGAFVLEFGLSSEGKSVAVSMSLKPEVKAQFDIGLGSGNTATEVTNQVVVESKATLSKSAVKFERELDLGTLKPKCFTVAVGPVPVLICPELQFTYGMTAEGKLGATVKVSYGREIGSRVETRGEQVSATSINRELGTNGSSVALSAALKLKTGPAAKLTVYLMGLAGPSVRVEIFTELAADTFADPWWKVSLGINVGAGLSGRLFKWKFEWSEDELLQFTTDLAAADGPFKGLLIDDHPDQLQLGTSHTFGAAVRGYPAAEPTWRLISGPGEISTAGVYQSSGTQMGDVVIEAMTPGGVGRPALAKRTQFRVGPGVPAPPVNVGAKPTPLGADATWDAAFDGGSPVTHYAVRTVPDSGVRYVPAPTRTFRISGLDPMEFYSVSVYAVNAQGTSLASRPSATFVPGEGVVKIGTATNVAVTATGEASTRNLGMAQAASGDGRYVFFAVQAQSNLAPADIFRPGDATYFLVRKDLETGAIDLASRGPDGTTPQPVHQFESIAVNQNGDVVAFKTPEGGEFSSIYVHNLGTRSTWLGGRARAWDMAMSDSGEAIAYEDGPVGDIFATVYRSVRGGTSTPVGESCKLGDSDVLISGDGKKVGYSSWNYCTLTDPREDFFSRGYVYDSGSGATTTIPPAAGLSVRLDGLSRDGASFAGLASPVHPADGPPALVLKTVASGTVVPGDRRFVVDGRLALSKDSVSGDLNEILFGGGPDSGYRVYRVDSGDVVSLRRYNTGQSFETASLNSGGGLVLWSPHGGCPGCELTVFAQRI